jgi:hypothetical protein
MTIIPTLASVQCDVQFSNHQSITEAIDTLQYVHGTTNTAAALRFLRESAFTTANGDRADVPNYAIVLTDGGSNDPAETAEQAFLVRRLVGDKLGSNR